jgi:hypothetical protein
MSGDDDGTGVRRVHVTQHGHSRRGDAFDLWRTETGLLRELFTQWAATDPHGTTGEEAVLAKWDHGTVGKLLIEHSAVRLSASEEVARVLRQLGHPDRATRLEETATAVRPLVERLYQSGRGIQPISLAITPDFVDAVGALHDALRMDLEDEGMVGTLSGVLGTHRGDLRSARFIRRHAPARARSGRWSHRFAVVARFRTAIDRLAGLPWAESSVADRKLAEHYDTEP